MTLSTRLLDFKIVYFGLKAKLNKTLLAFCELIDQILETTRHRQGMCQALQGVCLRWGHAQKIIYKMHL